MLTTPDSFEMPPKEGEKILLAEARLKVVQGEVLGATKELASLQDEAETIKRAIEYAATQLEALNNANEVAEGREDILRTQFEDLSEAVKSLTEDSKNISERNTHDATLLDKRESEVSEKEFAVQKQIEEYTEASKVLIRDRQEVDNAMKAFSDACAKVTWK